MTKKLIMALVLAAFASPIALRAEGPAHKGPDTEKRLEVLTERLSLTPEQQEKVKGIMEEKKKAMENLGGQMKAANEKARADIEAVLTPEQKAKFAEMKEKGREKMREKRKEKRAKPE